MTSGFLIYEIKTAVLFAVFYLFYRLLLSKETFHRLNRAVLLCSVMASALLPLLRITVHKTVEIPARIGNTADIPIVADLGQAGKTFPIDDILLYILAAGAIAIIANTAKLASLLKIVFIFIDKPSLSSRKTKSMFS